jgi:mannitol/fructose-specific phosphotransferase system IIA component (Ntr-type)
LEVSPIVKRAFENERPMLDLPHRDLESILDAIARHAVVLGAVKPEARTEVVQALLRRHEESSSALQHGIAVPHCYLEEAFDEPTVLFARLDHPINLGAPDGVPTRYIFVILGAPGDADGHLDVLMNIARLGSDDQFRYEIGEARCGQDLRAAVESWISRHPTTAEGPKASQTEDELTFTGRLAGGLMADIRRKAAGYKADFTDGLHPKTISATLFLFFACLAPAVTFGGLMGVFTEGAIGVVEMIVATAIGGGIFAMLAGQPLVVLGGIGPLLIFTGILFQLSKDMGVPFLPAYACTGLWTGLFLFVLSVTDASALMRLFTRFTNEIFSVLMSLIFIYEAVRAIGGLFADAGDIVSHDTALLTLLLALGTYWIGTQLKQMRRSRYLSNSIREFLSDFGPAIAMGLMTVVGLSLSAVHLPSLQAPDALGTTSGRAWFVNPFDVPGWVLAATAIPALLAALLIAVNQNITGRIISAPEHKLTRGSGFHLDLLIVGALVALASLFGLPWLTAATVRSLAHLRALSTVEDQLEPDGQTREHIVHVRETRLTGLAIHVMIGASLALLSVFHYIPMAVLYGLFLYMGIVSLSGIQFIERMTLWPMDSSLYPSTHYIRRVPLSAVHRFTAIQLVAVTGLFWVVAFAPPALRLAFPLFIVLLVPLRMVMNRIFEEPHLLALDGPSDPHDEEEHWN